MPVNPPAVVTTSLTQGYASKGFWPGPINTRPNDVNAYVGNDVIGYDAAQSAALMFPNVGPAGGGEVSFLGTQFRIDVSAVISGMTTFRLYLYNVTPPSALADNAAWDLPAGDRAAYLDYLDLGAPVDLGSTLFVSTSGLVKPVTLLSSAVWGYLVTNGGFTPSALMPFFPTLHNVAP